MTRLSITLTWLSWLLLLGALATVIYVLSGGIGHRLGMMHYRDALATLRVGASLAMPLAIGALLLLIVNAVTRMPWRFLLASLLGLLMSVSVLLPASLFQAQARAVPPIHDITTDTVDPPVFVALWETRAAAPNPPDYPGDSVARQQKAAYPDIVPIQLNHPFPRAFALAVLAATDMGWHIVYADESEGRIEAVATTLFYGFKDDVVIRVRAQGPDRTVVDVRSASRVGRSDVGANAKRIRAFAARLDASSKRQ